MKNQFMLTPFFLDQAVPGLMPVAQENWQINQPALPSGTPQARMAHLYHPLADFMHKSLKNGARPVSVAGDCCTSIGVIAGLQRAALNPTLIWLDAHGDFNTWDTTPSGFLGGMPLAMLVGHGEQTMLEQTGASPLSESKIILTDARDLDPGEKTALTQSAVTLLPHVDHLLDFDLPAGPLYVHFDVDILDSAALPAVSYPAAGGPSVETVRRVFRHLARTEQIAAISVSAWNPKLDEDGRCRDIVMGLLAELVMS